MAGVLRSHVLIGCERLDTKTSDTDDDVRNRNFFAGMTTVLCNQPKTVVTSILACLFDNLGFPQMFDNYVSNNDNPTRGNLMYVFYTFKRPDSALYASS